MEKLDERLSYRRVTQRLAGDFFQARGYAAVEAINTDQRLADRLEYLIKMYTTAKGF